MEECSLRSFTTVDSQIVFGRSMGRLTGFTKWRSDCLAGVSDGSLIKWPNHESLLFIIKILHGFIWVRSYKDSLDIVRGQFTRITLRSRSSLKRVCFVFKGFSQSAKL